MTKLATHLIVGFVAMIMVLSNCSTAQQNHSVSMELENIQALGEDCVDGKFVVRDHILCLSGAISEGTQKAIENKLKDIDLLLIDSAGGDALATLELAIEIKANNIEAVVLNRCISSCFNYILPSASQIYLSEGVVMYGHGWPTTSPEGILNSCSKKRGLKKRITCLEIKDKTARLQEKLFEMAPVGRAIMNKYYGHFLGVKKPSICEENQCDFRMYIDDRNIAEFYTNVIWIEPLIDQTPNDPCHGGGSFLVFNGYQCALVE